MLSNNVAAALKTGPRAFDVDILLMITHTGDMSHPVFYCTSTDNNNILIENEPYFKRIYSFSMMKNCHHDILLKMSLQQCKIISNWYFSSYKESKYIKYFHIPATLDQARIE